MNCGELCDFGRFGSKGSKKTQNQKLAKKGKRQKETAMKSNSVSTRLSKLVGNGTCLDRPKVWMIEATNFQPL